MKKQCGLFCEYGCTDSADLNAGPPFDPALDPEKKRVLLHACCGPCATACVERLTLEMGYSVTVFYYNPNITDEKEYYLRRDNLQKFIRLFNEEHARETFVSYIEGNYEPEVFIRKAGPLRDEPEGGRRCDVCFEMRLAETAKIAKRMDMDFFTTSMTVSPHKNYAKISKLGKLLGESAGIEYLDIDFKKKNGFGRSVELSKKYGLYRQRFCGCDYAKAMMPEFAHKD